MLKLIWLSQLGFFRVGINICSAPRVIVAFHQINKNLLRMQTNAGLEVDARQIGLYSPLRADDIAKYAVAQPENAGFGPDAAGASTFPSSPETPRKIVGLRQTIFVLSVLLAVVLILGVASAALAGHYAMRSKE